MFAAVKGLSFHLLPCGAFKATLLDSALAPALAAETPYVSQANEKPIDELPRNDGWVDVEYDFGASPEDNARISAVLNEACHVFRHHAGGTWTGRDKNAYAQLLAQEISARPGLTGRLLNTDDRVVKSLTYRALELLKVR